MVMMLIAGATIFGKFLAVTRIPFDLASWVGGFDLPPFVVMAMVIGIYFFGGCFMDALAFVTLTVPIFYPVVMSLGYDPIWFGIIIVMVTEMGVITPPVGALVPLLPLALSAGIACSEGGPAGPGEPDPADDNAAEPQVSSVHIEPVEDDFVIVGAAIQLSATVRDAHGTELPRAASWTTLDPDLVAIGADGRLSVFTDESGHANGLMFHSTGKLIACEMDGRLVRWNVETCERAVIVDEYNGQFD